MNWLDKLNILHQVPTRRRCTSYQPKVEYSAVGVQPVRRGVPSGSTKKSEGHGVMTPQPFGLFLLSVQVPSNPLNCHVHFFMGFLSQCTWILYSLGYRGFTSWAMIEYSAVGVPPVRQGVPFVRRGVPFATFRYLLEFEITTPYEIFVMMKNILIEWLPAIE